MRILRIAVAAAAVVVLLAACEPIRYDIWTGLLSSNAQRRVAPIEVHDGPGLDIRLRDCNRVVVSFSGAEPPREDQTWTLRPIARVTDAEGTVLYDTMSHASLWVEPAGSRVVDTHDDGGVDRIFVPVAGAAGTLTIESGCTNYAGWGSGGGFTWTFPPCTTSSRSCAAVQGGTPTLTFPSP